MSSHIISLPFRRTHPVSLASAIRQYISDKYDQHPDMFVHDMDKIDKIRSDAVNTLEAHASGIRTITVYAVQLAAISSKFPIDIGVDFSWYPALGFNTQRPQSENNLRYERANVLYNLAAVYSQLALSANRSTSEGLKTACNYFSLAAGVISYIKDESVPELRTSPPEDMDIMTLESLQNLLLAQGQECFWSKAVKDGMSDGTIAKLAAKVSDFYNDAADYGTKSEVISTDWIHHMSAKHHHFAAAAQYRASRECLEKQNYGEEVARLRDSLTCVNEALKESRWLNKMVLADLQALKTKVSDDLKRAEKDNDLIYLLPVPPKAELKILGRAGMASIRIPEEVSDPIKAVADGGHFAPPLFARLVPYAVHVAASIYEEKRNRLVNTSIIDKLEDLTQLMNSLLASLSLPGSLQAIERPLGIPPLVHSHRDEIKQQDGLHRLHRSMHEISKLRNSDRAIYEEGVASLKAEEAEDEGARRKHGTARWTRPSSVQAADRLYTQMHELDGYLKSAASSDELVRVKLKEQEDTIKVLEGHSRDLEDFIPSSRRIQATPGVERAVSNLRQLLNEVSRLQSRRRTEIASIRDKAEADDINSVILAEAARLERELPMQKIEPAQFETFFQRRLEMYNECQKSISSETRRQEELAVSLKSANAAFEDARRGDASSRDRERALQQLDNAYHKYKEIMSNLETGRKFYNDLASIVGRFRDDCKNFAYQRRLEANSLEMDLVNSVSAMNLGSPNTASLANAHQFSQMQPPVQNHSAPAAHFSHHDVPPANFARPFDQQLQAPIPQRPNIQPPAALSQTSTQPPPPNGSGLGMWHPEMGIKFGSGSGGGTSSAGLTGTDGQSRKGSTWDHSQGLKFK